MQYYLSKYVDLPFDAAVLAVRAAVAEQGFGIPVEIDFTAMMQEKLGASVRPYLILGTCMPKLALQAVAAEEQIGVLLPCNWVVQEHADGRVEVSAQNPAAIGLLTDNEALRPLMQDAQVRIMAALDAI
jgi:uncharacterized protein (DUF302 family)